MRNVVQMADSGARTACGSARSLQRRIFRRHHTIVLTLATREVSHIVCETSRHSRGEIYSNGQTDRQTQTTTVTLAAHARRGLNIAYVYPCIHTDLYKNKSQHCRNCSVQ